MNPYHLALLPLDDRPVNYDYPQKLAEAGGVQLSVPPKEFLGNPVREANKNELFNWLNENSRTVDGIILSIDTLVHGGLVASRQINCDIKKLLPSLENIKQLRNNNPTLTIYTFNVIQRVSRDQSAEEEKYYWADYGTLIFRLSYLDHKIQCNMHSEAEYLEYSIIHNKIPTKYLDDYSQTRKRNHMINLQMLDFIDEGIVDYLILPQDDTAEYGWNVAEANILENEIRKRNLSDKAIIYPGTDEISTLLLARYMGKIYDVKPSIYPIYSSNDGAQACTAYEDRPIGDLLNAQIQTIQGKVVNHIENANIVLGINSPEINQGDGVFQWLIENKENLEKKGPPQSSQLLYDHFINHPSYNETEYEMKASIESVEQFVLKIKEAIDNDKITAIADIRFYNGSDVNLIRELLNKACLSLAGYAGWNTAGNTLGTVLAQSFIRMICQTHIDPYEARKAHISFLLTRIFEDCYYQGLLRTEVLMTKWPDDSRASLEKIEDALTREYFIQYIHSSLNKFCALYENSKINGNLIRKITIKKIWLPWNRLFEIGLDLEIDL